MIWACTACLSPTKRLLGLYGLTFNPVILQLSTCILFNLPIAPSSHSRWISTWTITSIWTSPSSWTTTSVCCTDTRTIGSFGENLNNINIKFDTVVLIYRYRAIKAHSGKLLDMYWAVTCDFQQCVILTSVDTDMPVQPIFTPSNSKWWSFSGLIFIEYSSD